MLTVEEEYAVSSLADAARQLSELVKLEFPGGENKKIIEIMFHVERCLKKVRKEVLK